jgi:uncharacterized protein
VNNPLDLFRNPTFWSAFLGWMAAQSAKMAINLGRTKRIDFTYLVSLGGMPSAHSAMVSALALSTALNAGFGSQAFAVALALAIVVMFDASTVRRASGLQARLLNQILDELFKEHHLSQSKLKELLGHTRTEVFVGMLLGLAVALGVNAAGNALR